MRRVESSVLKTKPKLEMLEVMLSQIKKPLIVLVLLIILLLLLMNQARAGLIIYSDRVAFENAATSPLAFEGFNVNGTSTVDLSSNRNFNRYRTTSNHVSEGEKAISIYENDTFTVGFGHDVFAVGFDINELNSGNLNYFDSAGHSIFDALLVTEVTAASTFFGVISDTALTSFSLQGTGDSDTATYGFDALSYTADPNAVSEPLTISLFALALLVILRRKFKN